MKERVKAEEKVALNDKVKDKGEDKEQSPE